MKARFLSTAELELREAVEFYEAAREGLGAELLAEVEATARLTEAHPLAWTGLPPELIVPEPTVMVFSIK